MNHYHQYQTTMSPDDVFAPSMEREPTMNNHTQQVAKHLGIETIQAEKLLQLAHENIQLADRKQKDYGPDNISYSGEEGIIVRCQDKICRLKNLLSKVEEEVNNESIEDSYRDLANYALIGILLHKKDWD